MFSVDRSPVRLSRPLQPALEEKLLVFPILRQPLLRLPPGRRGLFNLTTTIQVKTAPKTPPPVSDVPPSIAARSRIAQEPVVFFSVFSAASPRHRDCILEEVPRKSHNLIDNTAESDKIHNSLGKTHILYR
jgi:hypothetical protein